MDLGFPELTITREMGARNTIYKFEGQGAMQLAAHCPPNS
jgi:hypothetical protein